MLRYALAAIGAAMLIALGIVVFYPPAKGTRPEPRILASGDPAAPPGGFTIHDAAPPEPAAPPPVAAPAPAPGADLDAVMQRLRAAAARPDAPAAPPATAPPAVTPTGPAVPPAPADPPPAPVVGTSEPPRWSSVTGQGTRWRMVRSANGYTVSIDLGGGQTADIHVQPAFGALDPQAINVRIDYLRDTIVQNFSTQSNSYTFARDGSVSLDR